MDANDFLKDALKAAKEVNDEANLPLKHYKIRCRVGWHDWTTWQNWGTARVLLGEVPIEQFLVFFRTCQDCNLRKTRSLKIDQ